MNKLDVALKLLQLLNERKTIDSKLVAHELNVSLRTAQRYLVELSILPCVITKTDSHSYSLNPDYELSGSLKVSGGPSGFGDPGVAKAFRKHTLNKTVCLLCGSQRGRAEGVSALASHERASTISKIDKLAALISKRQKGNKCSFP